MFSRVTPRAPRSRLQYAVRTWALLTSALHVVAVVGIGLIGSPQWGVLAVAILVGVLSGPVLLAAGSLEWSGGRAWAARNLGLLVMILGLIPLLSVSGLLAPFVFIALPAAWRWRAS